MIRKVLNISIVFLLLLSTNGVVIFSHYCSGTLVKQTVNVIPKSCCGSNCKHCRNVAKQIKVNDVFDKSNTNLDIKQDVKKLFYYNLSHIAYITNYSGFNLSNTLIKLLPHYARNLPVGDAVVFLRAFRL